MAEYAKTSEITPLIGSLGDSAILENLTGETKKEKLEPAEPEVKSLWKDTNARQKILFLFVVLGVFTVNICASLPAPFLARFVTDRGGHVIESTAVMQITIFALAISSVIFGKYQARIGSKILLISGIATFAICQCLFGLLSYVGNIHVFVTAGICLRAVQGIGQGAYAVSSLTLLCQEFPTHVGQVFGIIESAVGIGYLAGPILGSLLYSITNGMAAPFAISGATLLLLVPLGVITVKNTQQRKSSVTDTVNALDFIGTPGCILILGLATAMYGGFGIYNSTVTIYLENQSFTVIETGLTMFLCSITYCISSMIIGFVAGLGTALRRTILVMGLVGFCGASLLLTPNQTKTWIFMGVSFLGVCGGFTLISSFTELINMAVKKSIDDKTKFALHSTLSGSWNFVFGMGSFIFPLVGNELQKIMPFALSLLVAALGGYCIALVIAALMAIVFGCSGESSSEKIPLKR